MSAIGNILWILIGGGLVTAFMYLFGGIVLCATIVGIPFGLQAFKLAELAFLPFGRKVSALSPRSGCVAVLANVVWFLFAGLELAITHLVFALLCAVTIIGIPFARQHLKLARLALAPFGKIPV